MLGYVSPVLNPVSKRQQFLNTIRGITGSTKPVACWLPDTGDGKASVDPISGRIWTAETITNLVTNGGFEAGTTGWAGFSTGTIAQDSTQFKYGTHSGKVTAAAAFDGAQLSITLTTTVTYTLSCWAMVPTGKTFAIKILDAAATPVSPTTNLTGATGVWQYVTMTWVCGTAATFLQAFDNAASSYPYDAFIDGLQIETGSVVHPYIDTTVATATATSPIWAKGFGKGSVRVFDGATNYLTTPDTTDLSFGNGTTDTPYTLFAVATITDTAAQRNIICKLGNPNNEWGMFVDATDILVIENVDQSVGAVPNRVSNAAVTMGTVWHSFSGTYSAATGGGTAANDMTLYQDGVVVASTAGNAGTYVAMENLAVGVTLGANNLGANSWFSGNIAFVLIVGANLPIATHLALATACKAYFQF